MNGMGITLCHFLRVSTTRIWLCGWQSVHVCPRLRLCSDLSGSTPRINFRLNYYIPKLNSHANFQMNNFAANTLSWYPICYHRRIWVSPPLLLFLLVEFSMCHFTKKEKGRRRTSSKQPSAVPSLDDISVLVAFPLLSMCSSNSKIRLFVLQYCQPLEIAANHSVMGSTRKHICASRRNRSRHSNSSNTPRFPVLTEREETRSKCQKRRQLRGKKARKILFAQTFKICSWKKIQTIYVWK